MNRSGPLAAFIGIGNKRPGEMPTAAEWNALVAAVKVALNIGGPNVMHMASGTFIRRESLAPPPFLAKITGSASLSTNRWKYAWSEVVLDHTDDSFDILSGDRSGTTTTDYALNLVEAFNDGTGVQAPGVDIDGDDYPAGFSLQAIQGNPVVIMYPWSDDDGYIRYLFSLANAHDGTCA